MERLGHYPNIEIDYSQFKVEGEIFANQIEIGKNVVISPDTKIVANRISIGDGTVLIGTRIECQECVIGADGYINNVWIEGAHNSGQTRVAIGNEALILQGTRLNCNGEIIIGNDVNIGQNVAIWSHASSMDVFKGYPYTCSPVKIGSHVWITDSCRILPGIQIGDHVTIGVLSLVNKDLPSGCLAGGIPAKVIRENIYPKDLSRLEKQKVLEDSILFYENLLQQKPAWFRQVVEKVELCDELKVRMVAAGRETIFDMETRTMEGVLNVCSNDLRDFLRSRGLKIPLGVPYKSIPPEWVDKAMLRN